MGEDETDMTEDEFGAMWAEGQPVAVANYRLTIKDSPVLLRINTRSTGVAQENSAEENR